MCGIVGFIDTQRTRDNAAALIEAMCKVMRHRGPDEQGVWLGESFAERSEGSAVGVALGMRRLAIIDVAGGQQPITNEDGSIRVVFNGEIYNYRQLREQLETRGHRFQTTSDTETIVHAYEEYGDDCVLHLRGMFTFAIWDSKRHRLLAARDRFGKKPLNYYWDGQRLIFGSEIKSILEVGVPRVVNAPALDDYLTYLYVPAPHTLFKDIYKLPAAHLLIYEDGKISTRRYWELSFNATCPDDEATAIERTRALLREAVQIRLMSEVPLGAFLSGGIDSSTVVGLMSQMMSQPVKTFSIGFEEDDFSELEHARQVARHFGTDHHEFVVRPDLVSVLPQLAWAYDEPFADASMLPTYYVSRLAREHVTVVLSGDGGDEIFGGYTRYDREVVINRVPAPLRSLAGLGSALLPTGMRGKKRLSMMSQSLATRYARIFTSFPTGSRSALYTPEFAASIQQHDSYQWLMDMFKDAKSNAQSSDTITQLQYVDVRSYLTDDILVKVDKASMLNSIETRAPLLDQQLAEYVASLAPSIRVRNGVLKSLLKKAAADLLPSDILHRPKQGFGVPIKHWFRGELTQYAREILDSPTSRQRGIFQPQFIRNLLQTHADTTLVNHSEAIWALLCLEHWFQVYMDTMNTPSRQPVEVNTISTTITTHS